MRYCIDAYEVTVEGSRGSVNQYAKDAVKPGGVARSLPGVLPSTGVSWGQAAALCANTPVLSGGGEVVGYKRLPTAQEWLDAGDGVFGPGGLRYPYGDVAEPGRCACGFVGIMAIYKSVQPSGSLEGCVSRFGVYDLSGNIWEWVDARATIDIERWWDEVGWEHLAADDEGLLYSTADPPKLPRRLIPDIPGIVPQSFAVDEQGYLVVKVDYQHSDQWQQGLWGFLNSRGRANPHRLLPVQLASMMDPTQPVRLRVMTERDGQPITQKIGGAYYTAQIDDCPLSEEVGSINHPHDFQGTIGFRCVADPLVSP